MRRARRWVLAAVGAVVVLLAGGYAVFALRGDDAPPPPSLSDGAGGRPAAGRFAVAPSTGMFAGYRVREHYLGVGTRTAVGRTPAVTGNLTLVLTAPGRLR